MKTPHDWLRTLEARPEPRPWFLLGALALLSAVLLPAAHVRFIDGDEGFYLMAARLVSEGKHLYSDFFFPQMPVVPKVIGLWFSIVGAGWERARLLAGLVAVATGLVLALEVRRRTASLFWALAAIVLYVGSGLVIGWFTTCKTYGLGALLLLGGVLLLERSVTARETFFAGLLLALAGGTRLYLLAVLPCAALHLLRRDGRRAGRRLLALGAGALTGLLLFLPVVLRDPRAFYFGTVVFHSLRDPGALRLAGQWKNKSNLLMALFPIQGSEGTFSVQFLELLVLAIASALSRSTRANRLTTYTWVVLLVASLVPTPSYPQYFCLLIPFLILDVVAVLSPIALARLRPFLIPAAVAYVGLGVFDGYRYLVSGARVPGVQSTDRIPRWSIATMKKVDKEIDARRAREAISWWPGYFVGTRTPIAVELANDFGMVVADKLPEAERRRLHIVTHRDVADWIRAGRSPLVVAGNWTASAEGDLLAPSGYTAVAHIDNVTVWAR